MGENFSNAVWESEGEGGGAKEWWVISRIKRSYEKCEI